MNDLFCSWSSSSGKYRSTETEMPMSRSPERGDAKMLKHFFFFFVIKGKRCGQKTAVSQGPRCLLCHFCFILLWQKACTVLLRHQDSPSDSVLPWCSDDDQDITRRKGEGDLPFHKAPAMHWSHRGYRSRAKSRFGSIIFWLFWGINCKSEAVPL